MAMDMDTIKGTLPLGGVYNFSVLVRHTYFLWLLRTIIE